MRSRKGQTLIMAIIILGVLLIVGFVFLGIVGRNIRFASRSQQRSVATDLAEAGVRFVHAQMLNSNSGADFQPTPTLPIGYVNAANPGRDPDIDLLRPDEDGNGPDLGGPDGLGAYSRISYDSGRSIVRVRYAPSDANVFAASPTGALREPGKARNYLIIESFGRPGRVTPNDPTTLAGTDRRESRKTIAFVPLGIIESALYIHNKYAVSRPAEIGFATESGAVHDTNRVNVPIQLGGSYKGPAGSTLLGGGSMYCNADLLVHGHMQSLLNRTYGDGISVSGTILGADQVAHLEVFGYNALNPAPTRFDLYNNSGFINGNPAPIRLASRDPQFLTLGGLVRDGIADTDTGFYPRYISRKEPPSVMRLDPTTKLNRYISMTRDSGVLTGAGNNGRWGHGHNPYINNSTDLQIRADEDGRQQVGSSESLFFDWLNPNNGQTGSGWKGPFYVPIGAFMQLEPDGFIIGRDARANVRLRNWRRPDGSDSGLSTIRYRLGYVNNQLYIVNTLTSGVDINAPNPNFANGVPFEGVVFFEGNVRIRGVIPTDAQLTVVSMGNIYIEGSITKGVVDVNGNRLNRPSRSSIMLMAKDYVVLNTTQFFGPRTRDYDYNNSVRSRVVMPAANGSFNLYTEFLLDPNSGLNPSVWTSFAQNYRQFVTPNSNTGAPIPTRLLVSHEMEDNGANPHTLFGLDVNYGFGNSFYNFELTPWNAASQFYPIGTNYAPAYGLGAQPWQRGLRFESIGFPIIDPAAVTTTPTAMTMSGNLGTYSFLLGDTTTLSWHATNLGAGAINDYGLAAAAIVPHDIRIDAAIFAEEGCFFVIPGQWFNPNPNDRRDTYASLGATQAEREQSRLDQFGSFPETPFYGEPLDVKVTIVGAVSQNMPPPISQQAEWLKKWGWIPREHGASGELIPWSHVTPGFDIANGAQYVPNLNLIYDPMLATGRVDGYDDSPANPYVRTDLAGRPLPPMPRLPVSPTLAYFGEVNP